MNYSTIIIASLAVGVPAATAFVVDPIIEWREEIAEAERRSTPIFGEVVVKSVLDPVKGPAVWGYFTKYRDDCDYAGLIPMVGSPSLWERTTLDHREDQPAGQTTNRPTGTQSFGTWYFPEARNISGADKLKIVAVHFCDASGTGRRITDSNGKSVYASFYRKETPFLEVPYPDP